MSEEVIRDVTIIEEKRPSAATIGAILTVIVGILGFVQSWFIIASPLIFGWIIIGAIGLFAFISGLAMLTDAGWGWGIATLMCVLSVFAGFVEIIGSFIPYLRITGWSGIGGAIGVCTLVFSAAALYFLYRPEVVIYEA